MGTERERREGRSSKHSFLSKQCFSICSTANSFTLDVGFSDDVTDLEDDVIDDGQFTPGVKVDDFARSSQGGLLAAVVPQLLSHQHEPSSLSWTESRVELR